ncbi:hypothetical protein H0H92_002897 [Tricholoma furcatifolium]|nr:hypothetical protein H0H92_002897 [Tricholoma furcatifolium]
MPVNPISPIANVFDDDDEDGWQDMPVVREDTSASGMDEEDQRKYHYQPSAKGASAANAIGNLIDVDDYGNEWRSKLDQNENDYTRLRGVEEDEADEVHLRTRYLFDEDKAMTPLSQMQATKNLLTEAQRIAYVGLCYLTTREMSQGLSVAKRKELKAAVGSMDLWALKIMEQKMIESLAEHGVLASDLVPPLMTTHTVANPEYDPSEAHRREEERSRVVHHDDGDTESISDRTLVNEPSTDGPTTSQKNASQPSHANHTPSNSISSTSSTSPPKGPPTYQTTARVLADTQTSTVPGVTTTLSTADQNVTLDIRWTVLCDLFLVLIADSVYDARSRVLLEMVALKLGLGWLDVVKFESRVTEALEIQEDVENMEQKEVIEGQQKAMKKKRYVMLGLATLGGGLVIGLSAGLLAPVIGAGLGAALTTIGIGGSAGFLAGTAGAAVITTGGVLTGSSIAVRGMAKRTQLVRTFDILPLHNNKRVSCILTVPGFITGPQDDVRLPFSVLDPIVGDVFSVLWEPEMIQETGDALKILTSEVLSQIGLTVLQATVMSAFVAALQWPIILTKLGYLIDNPWSNALDRARAAGRVLADVLIHRHLGVRPITLIGFSLGARVIFYALLELAKHKAFGVVQDVFLLGATVTASTKAWFEVRSVVSGRFVNAYCRNDWVLNYLFRASNGGIGTVAGLRPVLDVPELENIDVTDKIAGHMSYRTFMPLILDQLGFPVSADYFDDPVEPDFDGDRVVMTEEATPKKKGWFSRKKKDTPPQYVSRPPTATNGSFEKKPSQASMTSNEDDDLPPRMEANGSSTAEAGQDEPSQSAAANPEPESTPAEEPSHIPARAGFDLSAMKAILNEGAKPDELKFTSKPAGSDPPSLDRADSAPPRHKHRQSNAVAGPSSGQREDLSERLKRTLTLPHVPEPDFEEDEPIPPRQTASTTSDYFPSKTAGLQSNSFTPTPFASEAPSWGSPAVPDRFSYNANPSFGATPSFSPSWGSPTEQPNRSSYNNSSSSFSAAPSASHSHNGFGFHPHSSPPPMSGFPEAGLSFGGADGSITTISPGSDPWKIPSDLGAGKRANSFNQNPWS